MLWWWWCLVLEEVSPPRSPPLQPYCRQQTGRCMGCSATLCWQWDPGSGNILTHKAKLGLLFPPCWLNSVFPKMDLEAGWVQSSEMLKGRPFPRSEWLNRSRPHIFYNQVTLVASHATISRPKKKKEVGIEGTPIVEKRCKKHDITVCREGFTV